MKKVKNEITIEKLTELLSVIYPGFANPGCEEQTFQLMLSLHHGSKGLALHYNFLFTLSYHIIIILINLQSYVMGTI